MMKKSIVFVLVCILHTGLSAQTISGNLSLLVKQQIRLEGFDGLTTYPISKASIDSTGYFKLNYSANDYGVGYLISADKKPLILILSGENIVLKGEALSMIETMRFLKGQENLWFEQYAREHPIREQVISAWKYLEGIYTSDSLFLSQKMSRDIIMQEKNRIQSEDSLFLSSLPKESYVSWFLPTRKLVSSVSKVAQYRTEEIPSTIQAFRQLDYADPRLYKSGLFKDAIESHFWLLENGGFSLDSVFIQMALSIDAMIDGLVTDEEKLNEVTDYLFDLLERHSLFKASEHLALKVLTQNSCTLNSNLSNQLETYRAMKKGNIAPDILFSNLKSSNTENAKQPLKLSAVKSRYTVVVFGASWCPKCSEEIPAIAKFYAKWKKEGTEVVFISLDDEREAFAEFSADIPFISSCDFNKWESKAAKDYYVFATPTMFLLDSSRKIILRPHSVNQIDAWVDWYLIEGNPLP